MFGALLGTAVSVVHPVLAQLQDPNGREADHTPSRHLPLLAEIEAALQRLDDGTYGACESCGGRIPSARLEVLPHARHCVPYRPRSGP